MKIAGEVEVDVLHRQHLCKPTSCSTALHTKDGAQRGFSQGHDGFSSNLVQTKCQADGNSGFPYPGSGGCDGRHQDQVALINLLLVDEVDGNLGHMPAEADHLITRYAYALRHILYLP